MKWVVFGEAVDQFFKKLDLFKFGYGIERRFFKEREVFLNDIIAKGVKRIDIDLICVGADEMLQSFAHGYHTGIGICEAENILWSRVGIEQYFTNAAGQDLGFARARARDHHHGAFNAVHRTALLLVQSFVFFSECFC